MKVRKPEIGPGGEVTELTARERQIYNFILNYAALHGRPPSVRDIGAGVGLSSPSSVYFQLQKLEKQGLILLTKEKRKRNIRLPGFVAPEEEKPENPDAENEPPEPGPSVLETIPVLDVLREGEKEYRATAESYLHFEDGMDGEDLYAVRVRDSAMEGAGILPGDLVVADRREELENGCIAVIAVAGIPFVRFHRVVDGKSWFVAQDCLYEPVQGDRVQRADRVISVLRRF